MHSIQEESQDAECEVESPRELLLPTGEPTPAVNLKVERTAKPIPLVVALVVFIVLLFVPLNLQYKGHPLPEAHRCLAVVIFISILWATEALPLYVSSLAVPVVLVVARVVMPDPDVSAAPHWGPCEGAACATCDQPACDMLWHGLTPERAADSVVEQFFNPTMLLFLAGFTMGRAMDKFQLSNRLAVVMLRPFGERPQYILLGVMVLGAFVSAWISNIPGAVLSTSIANPILATVRRGDGLHKALLFGTAVACNIGGMLTPIASPQNVVAFSYTGKGLSFAHWLLFAMPFGIVLLLISWRVLFLRFPTRVDEIDMSSFRTQKNRLTHSQWIVAFTVFATVVLWAVFPLLADTLGNLGIIGLFPVILFFGFGFLDLNDFHNLNWSVMMLIGGGLSLGYAMQRSYLLQVLAEGIQSLLSGQSFWVFLVVFSSFMGIIANFVSSTIAAIIILPVVAQVGHDIGHQDGLVVASVVLCSGAMSLPVSSFPNANAFAQMDKDGNTVLAMKDYLTTGLPITLIALGVMSSLGYALAMALGW